MVQPNAMSGFALPKETSLIVVERIDRYRWIVKLGNEILGYVYGAEPGKDSVYDTLIRHGVISRRDEWHPREKVKMRWASRDRILGDPFGFGDGGPF